MHFRLALTVVAGALLLCPLAVAAAQDTAAVPVEATNDSAAQGYAPAEPAPAAPTAEPAPAAPAPDVQAAPEPTAASDPSAALEPTADTAPAGSISRAATLSSLGFVEILTPRSADRIQQAIEEARLGQREAEVELSEQEGLEGQVKAMVDVKKQEISTLDAQRKLAEKNKQPAEVAAFEAEKKDVERHKLFLEKRVSLHQAEKEAAKARKSLAEATQSALELELQLAHRRGARNGTAGTDPAATMRHESVIRELERKVLEAQRMEAEKEKQLADKHQDIAKRRLELYQAQAAAAGNR